MQRVHKQFDNIDELCHSLKSWDVEMYPLSPGGFAEYSDTIVQTGFNDGLYSYASFSSPLKMYGSPPDDLVTFNVMESSEKEYWWRGHNLNSAMAWVFPVGGELHSISPPGFKVHTLSVTEERIAEIAAACSIDLPSLSKRSEVFLVPGMVLDSMRSNLRRMSDCSIPFCYESLNELLLQLVPLWLKAGIPDNQRRPSMRVRNRAMCKSLEIIEECNLSTLNVELLIENCHVSKRTLEYAFRERFDSSPAALIKSIRLAATKAALRRTIVGQSTIAEISAQYGFWHPAQFAADYRKAFGELPSVTLGKSY